MVAPVLIGAGATAAEASDHDVEHVQAAVSPFAGGLGAARCTWRR